jgi:hypothetical protein
MIAACSGTNARLCGAVFSCSSFGGKAEIWTIVEFWRGDLSPGRAFWDIVGGGIVSLFATLLALMLVTATGPRRSCSAIIRRCPRA